MIASGGKWIYVRVEGGSERGGDDAGDTCEGGGRY